MFHLPIELINNIYTFTDIDTKCSLNKMFGIYFFKQTQVSHPPHLLLRIQQQSNVLRNKQKVLCDLLASIAIIL